MRLDEAYNQCLETQWKGTRGEVTACINAQTAVDYFGGASSLKSITPKRIQNFVEFLKGQGLAPATINRKLAALSKILTYGVHQRELASMPHVPYQREPEGRLRWLTREEEVKADLFFLSHGMVDHALVMAMLIDTGLRPSELWKLTARDYNAGALLIKRTKNGITRLIPLTKRCSIIVELRLSQYADQLFPFDNQWMNYGWNKMKKGIGLADDKEFVVYALRHTCASRLLQRDVALHVVQGWLGHTNPAQTMRYAHLSQANFQQAMKRLEEL